MQVRPGRRYTGKGKGCWVKTFGVETVMEGYDWLMSYVIHYNTAT